MPGLIAKLSLIKEKDCFYVNGNLEATLEYTCVRCLKKNPNKIDLPIKEKFITYHNIHKSLPKMDELIKKFEFTSFERYLKE